MPERLAMLTKAAERIASGELASPLIFDGEDDLAKLSRAFAQLATKMDGDHATQAAARRVDEALRELSNIKAALDAHSIVAITNAAGKITYINEKFCEISKYSREELIGQDHRIINSGFHPKSFFANLWKTIGNGKVWKGEIKNRAKDGSFYWVDTTIFPFIGIDGRPEQYVAIRTDITKRKEDELRMKFLADELAAKNKELETIVYVVSHDLRSPLLNVQGFAKALGRACNELRQHLAGDQTPEVARVFETEIPRALQFIESGVTKMDALLSGFLRFSRLGRVTVQFQSVDMDKLIRGVFDALHFQKDEVGAIFDSQPLPRCMGDSTLLGQVFSNLVDNALKYRDKSRQCQISVTGEIQGDRAIYRVSDNGIGIPSEYQAKIFELFHRLNPKQTQGEGLGLTIAQRILERLDGHISVESQPGHGACFFLSLPAIADSKTE